MLLLQAQSEKDDFKLPTGTVLRFSEVTDTMKREDIKDALTAIGESIPSTCLLG